MLHSNGLISASVLAMVLAGAFGGALAGLVLAGVLSSQLWLAVISAFIASVLALIVGHLTLGSRAERSSPPAMIVWNVAITSLIAGLAGHELSVDLRTPPASSLVGAMSGLLGSLLVASFAITVRQLTSRQLVD